MLANIYAYVLTSYRPTFTLPPSVLTSKLYINNTAKNVQCFPYWLNVMAKN